MLLTRLPLGGDSLSNFVQVRSLQKATSFDLHVLGMPPAFILSQDQTLQKNILFFQKFVQILANSELTFCSVFKDHSCSLFQVSKFSISNQIFKVNTFFNFFWFNIFLCQFRNWHWIIYQNKILKSSINFTFFKICFECLPFFETTLLIYHYFFIMSTIKCKKGNIFLK